MRSDGIVGCNRGRDGAEECGDGASMTLCCQRSTAGDVGEDRVDQPTDTFGVKLSTEVKVQIDQSVF